MASRAVRAEAVGVGTGGFGCYSSLIVAVTVSHGRTNQTAVSTCGATVTADSCIMRMRTRPIGRTAVAMPACAVGGCTVAVGTSAAGTATVVVAGHLGHGLGVGGAAAGGAYRVGTGSAHDKLTFDALPCAADKACRAGGVVAGPVPDSLVVLFPLGSEHLLDQRPGRRSIGGPL